MKKLITGIVLGCLGISAAAYASFEAITSNSFVESKQISNIKNDLDMKEIKSAFSGEIYIDENGEIQTTEGIDVECSTDDLVKKYHITYDNIVSDSLYYSISDTYKYYLPIKYNDDVVGMANIKIGKSVETLETKIDKLNISAADKNTMLENAKEREGKWYVSSIISYLDGEGYLMPAELQEKLADNGITDVEDIKYTSIENYANEAFCIKTIDSEYVVPIDLQTHITVQKNREIYSTEQVISAINGVNAIREVE